MRVIEANLGEVRTVAVSPDSRYVAASGASGGYAVFDWTIGMSVLRALLGHSEQFAFRHCPVGWFARVQNNTLRVDLVDLDAQVEERPFPGKFAGGVAVSPDGKTLVATQAYSGGYAKLSRWSLPAIQPKPGFDYWEPFRKLAFSPDGQFLAGIWQYSCELRYAESGGLDKRFQPRERRRDNDPIGFISFDRDSSTCTYGWKNEFHVLDISTGTSRELSSVDANFRDAAFTTSGQHFATVGDDGMLKLWDPRTWEVVREYDWGCGGLTCLAFTADGSAGVCGTADGRLVQFDVDE